MVRQIKSFSLPGWSFIGSDKLLTECKEKPVNEARNWAIM